MEPHRRKLPRHREKNRARSLGSKGINRLVSNQLYEKGGQRKKAIEWLLGITNHLNRVFCSGGGQSNLLSDWKKPGQ